MMRERSVERHLCSEVKKRGGMCIKLTQVVGITDRLVIVKGKVYFVELKRPGGVVRDVQKATHLRLEKLGQDVRVLDSIEAVNAFIREI